MIIFKQKIFSEYDAMRQLYVELMKDPRNRERFGVIDTSALIPVLRGNNIVIEKFTQATRVFGKDRYRMYLKIGAKAKLPDDVRLPQTTYTKSLGSLSLGMDYAIRERDGFSKDKDQKENDGKIGNTTPPKNNRVRGKDFSKTITIEEGVQKEFGNGGDRPFISASFKPNIDFLKYEVHKLLGDAIKYDKKERSLVLEFSTISDAIRALMILPFGLGYKIYLLNA